MTKIKATLGLLLPLVVAGAFAVTGSASATERRAPRDEGLPGLPRPRG